MNAVDFKDGIGSFRRLLQNKGFKVATKYQFIPDLGPGFIISIIDPADPNDICFARWLSVEDIRIVRRGNEIFWRFVI